MTDSTLVGAVTPHLFLRFAGTPDECALWKCGCVEPWMRLDPVNMRKTNNASFAKLPVAW
jgi:hypothetical protein